MSQADRRSPEAKAGRPAIEWIFGAVSAALVAALILFLGYRALLGNDRPANLSVVIERIDMVENGTIVTVAVANRGEKAASAVTVYASGVKEPDSAGRKEIQFDYIAGRAVRRGAFVFTDATITANDIELELGGFVEP